MQLLLELVINGLPTGRVVPVTKHGAKLMVPARSLLDVGIERDWPPESTVDLSKQAKAQAVYSASDQRLLLTVPAAWLPEQRIGKGRRTPRIEPDADFGALVNYDLYLTESKSGTFGSIRTEVRMFGKFGAVSNSGEYRQQTSRGGGHGQPYIRYDTTWTFVDDDAVLTYEVGDFVTRSLPWTSTVRMGGVQLSRDFSVRPDIVTYPTPFLSGSAAVPSALDLYVNGYRAASTTVEPGPFIVDEFPYVNGAGEAVMVTTDMQGRKVQLAIPFYVANTLLRPGLTDYAFSIGKLRRFYGSRSFSYHEWAGAASGRMGLTDFLTLEGTAEGARGHRLAGVGSVLRIGNLGVIDASASFSRQYGRDGRQLALGYQYTGRGFNLMARSVFRSDDFGDLSTYESSYRSLPERQIQAQSNVVLGEDYGNISAGYVETRREDDTFRLANLSYYKPLWGSSSLYVSVSRDLEQDATSAMAHLVLPFGQGNTAVTGVERTAQGATRTKASVSRAVPSRGGVGWNVGASLNSDERDRYQANLTWRTRFMQTSAGLYGTKDNQTFWGEATGSVVLMDGGAFFANRINDAFALVSTDGVADVPVHYENQEIGTTDGNGHLLIPSVPSYYGAKFTIDPLELPADTHIPIVERRAAVRNGSGRLLRFPVERSVSASLELLDGTGARLPPGTRIVDRQGNETWVGMDGSVYLQHLQPDNSLIATMPNGSNCVAEFSYEVTLQGAGHPDSVTCR